jgi:hypothetical protein
MKLILAVELIKSLDDEKIISVVNDIDQLLHYIVC